VVQVVGNNEIVLTSGDVSMVDASTNNPVSSLPDTTGDDYNITIGPNAITNGRLDVSLVSGGTTLDSITIADITDGVPAGYIESTGLVFKNIKGDSNINPSSTSLTATFENIGSTNFIETVDITPSLTLDGNPQMSYVITTIHPDIDLTVVDNNGITVNENQIVQTDSLTFTFIVGGRFSTSETVFFVSDGEQGIAGPQGIPGVSPKTVRLVADKQIMIVDSSETVIKPDTITFTTETQNTTGIVNWSISPANSGFNTAGNTATLSHTDWDVATPQYTITTTVDGISDSVTVKLLKEGSSTITGILSNEAVTLVVNDQTNTINDLTGTGTKLSVYQGEEKLDYLGTGSMTSGDANGTWRIQSIVYPTSRVTLNSPSVSGQDMLLSDIVSVIPSPIPTIGFSIEYIIQVKTLNSGSISTFTKEQTFTMSIQPPQKYTWIGYANDANGTGLSSSSSGKSHIGFAYEQLQQTPNFSNINSGWLLPFTKIEGEDGVPGAPGADGQTLYTWVLYAPNGSPFTSQVTQQPQTNTTHIGIAVNQTSSTERTDQTALNTLYTWTNFKGEQGPQGVPGPAGADGQTLYTWIRYADSADGTLNNSNDPTGRSYIGIAPNRTSATELTNPSLYNWTLIKGEDGVPGAPGADGQTLYTWIVYAPNGNPNSSEVTQTPTPTTTHIGIAPNRTSSVEDTSQTALDNHYVFSRFKGEDGEDGQPLRGPVEGSFNSDSGFPATPSAAGVTGANPNIWLAGDTIVDTATGNYPNTSIPKDGTTYIYAGGKWNIQTDINEISAEFGTIIAQLITVNDVFTTNATIESILTMGTNGEIRFDGNNRITSEGIRLELQSGGRPMDGPSLTEGSDIKWGNSIVLYGVNGFSTAYQSILNVVADRIKLNGNNLMTSNDVADLLEFVGVGTFTSPETRTWVDQALNTHTVTIEGGIITSWTVFT